MPTCIHCGTAVLTPFGRDQVTVRCTNVRCSKLTPTGREAAIREEWETLTAIPFPPVTAARAIGLSQSIYKTALKNRGTITMTKTHRKLNSKGYAGQMIACELIKGRAHRGVHQDSCTAGVVAIENPNQAIRVSIYVVFRGSAGDNNVGGYVENRDINVDWRANFDNRMEATDYAGSSILIHGGFKSVLASYRGEVRRALNRMREIANQAGHRHHTVITGHSQGAAHALLFAHWLDYVDPENPVVCIPFSPPRVGNLDFARDFTRRVTERVVLLPHDGWRTQSAFLMVKGDDPVCWNQKHAFGYEDHDVRNQKIDSYGSIVKKGMKASSWESRMSDLSQPYFHPKNLVKLGSLTPKIGLIKGLDHEPKLFRNKILGKL